MDSLALSQATGERPDEFVFAVTLLTASTAGIESTANTKSESSMHTRQSSSGVATVLPLPPSLVKKRSPSYSSTAPTRRFDILNARHSWRFET